MRQSVSCLLGTVAALLLAMVATRHVHVLYAFSVLYSAQVHVTLLAAGLAALSLLVKRNVPAFVLLAAALVMAVHMPVRVHRFGDMASAAEAAGQPSLKVLSFNVMGDNLENGEALREAILRSGADVAVILEALPLKTQLQALEAVYPYRLGCGVGTKGICDLMVLSKLPFAERTVGTLSDLRSERLMRVAVETGGGKVNIVAAHLSKPYFDMYHTSELRRLWRLLSRIEGPLVLAGDFNASSIAPDMMWFLIATGLRKAPVEPATWPIALGPLGIAIDHIYTRAPMRLTSVERLPDPLGSNHFGLIADLIIEQPGRR